MLNVRQLYSTISSSIYVFPRHILASIICRDDLNLWLLKRLLVCLTRERLTGRCLLEAIVAVSMTELVWFDLVFFVGRHLRHWALDSFHSTVKIPAVELIDFLLQKYHVFLFTTILLSIMFALTYKNTQYTAFVQ